MELHIAVMFYNNQEQHSLYLTADYSDDKRILAVVENFEKQFEKQLEKSHNQRGAARYQKAGHADLS